MCFEGDKQFCQQKTPLNQYKKREHVTMKALSDFYECKVAEKVTKKAWTKLHIIYLTKKKQNNLSHSRRRDYTR